jgi:hypothetical protein
MITFCRRFLSSSYTSCHSSLVMDLFIFYPLDQVLACKPCGYAIAPSCLASHVRTKHPVAMPAFPTLGPESQLSDS